MKQLAAVLSFLFMWFFVAIICGFVMGYLFPSGGLMYIGIGFNEDWRTWPGAILGVLAGIHSAKAALNPKPPRNKRGRSNANGGDGGVDGGGNDAADGGGCGDSGGGDGGGD